MRTFEWAIEDIIAAHPNLYLKPCAVMAAALMSQGSALPYEFAVECEGFSPPVLGGEKTFHLRASWTEQTGLQAKRVWHTEQPKSIVERAAVALAALLFAKLIPVGEIRVTREGDRADYWLRRVQCALEVSGTENPRKLRKRHRQKIAQVLSNPLGWNGYVVVACFSPSQRVIRWSYHEQVALNPVKRGGKRE
ncbi:hypothetical protein HYR99_13145 [Candidatus Poribacteria bacterium]|nr:hypothetical protein [Candidatus Poribacteria bacterium]